MNTGTNDSKGWVKCSWCGQSINTERVVCTNGYYYHEQCSTYKTLPKKDTNRTNIIDRINDELSRAYSKHGREPWGRHEFYAILKEEVDELWDVIKTDNSQNRVIEEAIQVAAMCIRYLETGDRYRGPFEFNVTE